MSTSTDPNDVESSPIYKDLQTRKSEIVARLADLELVPPPKKKPTGTLLFSPKSADTHWDFLLKEMMWLAADFSAERKRQCRLGRKVSNGLKKYHSTKASRKVQELAKAELKRRRLAAKIGRSLKGWWNKMDRVVAYQQKLRADQQRAKAMNQQLVSLVQQTERYTESLTFGDSKTIEQALKGPDRTRKRTRMDYTKLALSEHVLYGESTDEDDSDESFAPTLERDDETTLAQAEAMETRERLGSEEYDDEASFVADPHEIALLQEEQDLDIDIVLERLKTQGGQKEEEESNTSHRQVHFAQVLQDTSEMEQDNDSQEDNDSQDEDEEFPDVEPEPDNETTLMEEEKLPPEMDHKDEIHLLEAEGNMPIDELRKKYGLNESDAQLDETKSEKESEAASEPDAALSLPTKDDSECHEDETEANEKLDRTDPDEIHPMEIEQSDDTNTAKMIGLAEDDASDADEFRPDGDLPVDDETTIEAEEKLGRDMSYHDELALLKKENEMDIEELRAMYARMEEEQQQQQSESDEEEQPVSELVADKLECGDEEEFVPESEAVDDETTLIAEEKLGREMSAQDELAMLKRENEIPIERLLEIHNQMEAAVEEESEDEEEGLDGGSEKSTSKRKLEHAEDKGDRKKPRKEANVEEPDDGLAALNALEASAEKARTTLASRPFLLAPWVKLRKYQQIGLNWLVSVQSRRLNGILADEMGLGKTLQTIALLAYLASYKGIWGPHLVVVPTSVIVNWETEIKRFCPAFKVLCYYGSAKRRKELRTGWTKTNWNHIVITSYQLAVQDAFAFKRKRWYYLILDEAQNIKNFQSQRWQTLINFNTQRRLLLTGTPLQNNLMELWSLLHFLMPYIFRSRKEFSYWFSNPMNSMIEGKSDRNDAVIARLHGIIRPFVLRRLKKDVETQMPGKFEHIVKCQLSRRQMFIYEEYMARSSTRMALKKGGNFMGMMNVLMQLRKVCNHPDLFEPRSIVTPLVLDRIELLVPGCTIGALNSTNVLERVSTQLMMPLWCGSCGEPSLNATTRHDNLESEELRKLEARREVDSTLWETGGDYDKLPLELSNLLRDVHWRRQHEYEERVAFQNALNASRCRAPSFAYPSRLLDALRARSFPFDRREAEEKCGTKIISTPIELLRMRRSLQERADDVEERMKTFVFCVPKAGAARPRLDAKGSDRDSVPASTLKTMLLEPLEEYLKPYRKVHARLSSFFPDKRLIQFDSGKLRTLAVLLHELKRGGHKALVFTQMSKMLDTLEAFLNLNGHTYLRLDGSTGVDRRQRLMDRFNNDPKVFCFILSTRSGGMGINLTGADTVIFYDSDWNPAMDAQAQDRAHRIGQTRDVHIYRLITEHTIEENILVKAKQKRNLDVMVMDGGKFDASQMYGERKTAEDDEKPEQVQNVYTKGSLRDILGIKSDPEDTTSAAEAEDGKTEILSKEQMERAMASLEDEDDALALKGAQKEAVDDLKEFDESIELKKDTDSDDEDADASETAKPSQSQQVQAANDDEKNEEEELEKEFAAWQSKVGLDADAVEASLSPTERYGLHFRTDIDPFYSIFAIQEQKRKMEAEEDDDDSFDVDEIEREKALEERRAIDDGDLLATEPSPSDLIWQRNLYLRERGRLRAEKKRRKLTGENWSTKIDGASQMPFWYNSDTGEALWDKPSVLIQLEEHRTATERGWVALPNKPLVHVMSFLVPFPERTKCSTVCHQWRRAANDISFVKHVYPVEMGALTRDDSKMEPNHYRTIAEALAVALPGDTIELGDGHYWVQNPGLTIEVPLKFVGDENNAANVVIETIGTIKWLGGGGLIEGITFRRPKISSGEEHSEMLRAQGKVDVVHSVIDNEGSSSHVVRFTGKKARGKWFDVSVRNGGSGILLDSGARLELEQCLVKRSSGHGIESRDGTFEIRETRVEGHRATGAVLANSHGKIDKCTFLMNGDVVEVDTTSSLACNNNICIESSQKEVVPGFSLRIEDVPSLLS